MAFAAFRRFTVLRRPALTGVRSVLERRLIASPWVQDRASYRLKRVLRKGLGRALCNYSVRKAQCPLTRRLQFVMSAIPPESGHEAGRLARPLRAEKQTLLPVSGSDRGSRFSSALADVLSAASRQRNLVSAGTSAAMTPLRCCGWDSGHDEAGRSLSLSPLAGYALASNSAIPPAGNTTCRGTAASPEVHHSQMARTGRR